MCLEESESDHTDRVDNPLLPSSRILPVETRFQCHSTFAYECLHCLDGNELSGRTLAVQHDAGSGVRADAQRIRRGHCHLYGTAGPHPGRIPRRRAARRVLRRWRRATHRKPDYLSPGQGSYRVQSRVQPRGHCRPSDAVSAGAYTLGNLLQRRPCGTRHRGQHLGTANQPGQSYRW